VPCNNHDVTVVIVADDQDYTFPATAPLDSETHGGDDVLVFARGPWSHLFAGTFEQNFIPHVMAFASCVGHGQTMCDLTDIESNSTGSHIDNMQLLFICSFAIITLLRIF